MVICAGAILAFAVTTNTSVFNLHTAGWVIMIIGVIGLVVPRRAYGWLGRRMVRRSTWEAGSSRGAGRLDGLTVTAVHRSAYSTDTTAAR